uniref:Uncharacterized protein n=1 Tax=Peronospora matthiolae TaxID=2874970 RepID=A0AAV1TWW4_9STRA
MTQHPDGARRWLTKDAAHLRRNAGYKKQVLLHGVHKTHDNQENARCKRAHVRAQKKDAASPNPLVLFGLFSSSTRRANEKTSAQSDRSLAPEYRKPHVQVRIVMPSRQVFSTLQLTRMKSLRKRRPTSARNPRALVQRRHGQNRAGNAHFDLRAQTRSVHGTHSQAWSCIHASCLVSREAVISCVVSLKSDWPAPRSSRRRCLSKLALGGAGANATVHTGRRSPLLPFPPPSLCTACSYESHRERSGRTNSSPMTISANVRKELFEMTNCEGRLIRIKPTEAKAGTTVYSSKQSQPLKMWTQEEHEKFLQAMEKYPAGPWKVIAAFIGTKTTRQTMTHAQKYRQKISRWRRGLRHKGRKHMSDDSHMRQRVATGYDHYVAKENLYKALEYVSSDEMSSSCSSSHAVHPSSVSPARSLSGVAGHEACRSGELFRLAELASHQVMKQEPRLMSSMPSSPPDVEMVDISSPVRVKQEITACASVEFRGKIRKMEWNNDPSGFGQASPEWSMQKNEVRLSPLRASPDGSLFPVRKFGGVLNAITGMSYQNAQSRLPLPLSSTSMHKTLSPMRDVEVGGRKLFVQQRGADVFRLPPLTVANGQAPNVYPIPPLRSKIDPSVLSGRAYYALTN